jgi:LmbE family N-acetylglucosaminyl deacetylase
MCRPDHNNQPMSRAARIGTLDAMVSARALTARALVVFHAHPDDEALLTAGTMARAVDQGHRVVLVVATDGELGRTRAPVEPDTRLGRWRARLS